MLGKTCRRSRQSFFKKHISGFLRGKETGLNAFSRLTEKV